MRVAGDERRGDGAALAGQRRADARGDARAHRLAARRATSAAPSAAGRHRSSAARRAHSRPRPAGRTRRGAGNRRRPASTGAGGGISTAVSAEPSARAAPRRRRGASARARAPAVASASSRSIGARRDHEPRAFGQRIDRDQPALDHDRPEPMLQHRRRDRARLDLRRREAERDRAERRRAARAARSRRQRRATSAAASDQTPAPSQRGGSACEPEIDPDAGAHQHRQPQRPALALGEEASAEPRQRAAPRSSGADRRLPRRYRARVPIAISLPSPACSIRRRSRATCAPAGAGCMTRQMRLCYIARHERRRPLRPLAHRLPAYRRRAHGAVQLALSRAIIGGKFLLRIEDTDRARSTAGSGRRDHRRAHTGSGSIGTARSCMQSARAGAPRRGRARSCSPPGHAYHCYCTPEELEAMREQARAEGRRSRYDGRWRDRDPDDAPPDVTPVIRLKAPQTGETVIDDHVQGTVTVANAAARRSHHPARRRHADLQSLGRGRRSRHGHHAMSSAATITSPTPSARPQIYRALGWDGAGIRACAADPRARRRQAVEAPWRARRRRLSRHGLSARGAAQLSAAPRLEPWRRRDHLDRAGDRTGSIIDAVGRVAGALRFRQARQRQRAIIIRDSRRRAARRR